MKGNFYRLLINIDSTLTLNSKVALAELDAPLPGGTWSEGWHTADIALDYVATLKLHANQFTPYSPPLLVDRILAQLAFDAPISVFAFGYGADGGHKIHRNSASSDGAVVVRPTTEQPHFLLFRFDNQNF